MMMNDNDENVSHYLLIIYNSLLLLSSHYKYCFILNMLSHYFKVFSLLCVSAALCQGALTDKATGIDFAPQLNGLDLFGVGVRKKGPIKVRKFRRSQSFPSYV